jgi:hypothetical protein
MLPVAARVQASLTCDARAYDPFVKRPRYGTRATHELAFESYGVRVAVATMNEEWIERVKTMLPPGWQPCDPEVVDKRFAIEPDSQMRWMLSRDGKPVTEAGLGPDHVIMLFESQMRAFVALNAPSLIFVHAGVVAVDDRLLVMPGFSFAGKTTLVAALVEAGATYYSDEYAPIDEAGLVHPYARQLSLRRSGARADAHVNEFGGEPGDKPLPIAQIVVTNYRPGAEWQPRSLSPGASVMAMLSHAVPAQSRPEQSMRHLTRAADGALAFESERAEADALAPILIDQLTA